MFSQFNGHVGGLRLILCSVTEWISTKAVVMSLVRQGVLRDAFAGVPRFRSELYECLTARGDALSELEGARIGTVVVPQLQDRHRSWRSWNCDAL